MECRLAVTLLVCISPSHRLHSQLSKTWVGVAFIMQSTKSVSAFLWQSAKYTALENYPLYGIIPLPHSDANDVVVGGVGGFKRVGLN